MALKKFKLLIWATLSILCSNVNAYYCSEPSPPFTKPQKPNTPYCVNEWTNSHTCDDWQVDSYNRELEAYNRDVERYINDLQVYVSNAANYAQCEIENLE